MDTLVPRVARVRRGRIARRPGELHANISGQFKADSTGQMRPYAQNQQMRATQGFIVEDVIRGINDTLRDMGGMAEANMVAVGEEFDALRDDLETQTPWHEPGPSDPPLHAAEVWRSAFYPNGRGSFTLTMSNPKYYLPFLEAGWSPQAPSGWIAAAWLLFKVNLQRRLGGG